MEANLNYIQYLTARLASFRNIWWSLANEYDYVKSKTDADWLTLTKAVVKMTHIVIYVQFMEVQQNTLNIGDQNLHMFLYKTKHQ